MTAFDLVSIRGAVVDSSSGRWIVEFLLLIGIGAVLPWVDKQLPVKVYILGSQSGLERLWVRRLLIVAGVGVLVEIGRAMDSDWRTILELVLVGIGGLIATITVLTGPFTSRWTPDFGVYVSLVGSLLVMLGASIALITTRHASHSRMPWSSGD
jgi:uncharacterized protein (DUF697 family)